MTRVRCQAVGYVRSAKLTLAAAATDVAIN